MKNLYTLLLISIFISCKKEYSVINRLNSEGSYTSVYKIDEKSYTGNLFVNKINNDLYIQFNYSDNTQVYKKMNFNSTTEFSIDFELPNIKISNSYGKIIDKDNIEITYINNDNKFNYIQAIRNGD